MDWNLINPRDAFEALKHAPQIAGPWENDDFPVRRTPQGSIVVWERTPGQVFIHNWVFESVVSLMEKPNTFATQEEADVRLRELGWILVD